MPPSARRSRWTGIWRVLTRKPGRIVGLSILVFFVLMGTFGPMLYGDQLAIDPDAIYQAPSAEHWLGTDFAGSDVLQRHRRRQPLCTAHLFPRRPVRLDARHHRRSPRRLPPRLARLRADAVTDFVLTIPGLPLLVVLTTVWKFDSPLEMGLVLGVVGWGGIARAVRSQTLSLRERGFLEAARGLGPAQPAHHRARAPPEHRAVRGDDTCSCRSSASSRPRSACSSSASCRSPAPTGA